MVENEQSTNMRKHETKRKEEREKKIAAKNNKVDKMRKRKEERERERKPGTETMPS